MLADFALYLCVRRDTHARLQAYLSPHTHQHRALEQGLAAAVAAVGLGSHFPSGLVGLVCLYLSGPPADSERSDAELFSF